MRGHDRPALLASILLLRRWLSAGSYTPAEPVTGAVVTVRSALINHEPRTQGVPDHVSYVHARLRGHARARATAWHGEVHVLEQSEDAGARRLGGRGGRHAGHIAAGHVPTACAAPARSGALGNASRRRAAVQLILTQRPEGRLTMHCSGVGYTTSPCARVRRELSAMVGPHGMGSEIVTTAGAGTWPIGATVSRTSTLSPANAAICGGGGGTTAAPIQRETVSGVRTGPLKRVSRSPKYPRVSVWAMGPWNGLPPAPSRSPTTTPARGWPHLPTTYPSRSAQPSLPNSAVC